MIDAIRDALAACTVLNLAYADEDGPQACAVFYALAGDGSLVFVSSASTRHGRALAARDGVAVAFTVQAGDQTWDTLRGVQGAGTCHRPTDADLDAARAAYAERFPFVAADARLARAMETSDHWRIRPTRLRLIDNSKGFGHRTEWP